MAKIRADFYVHDDWSDDKESEIETLVEAGMSQEQAEAFVKDNSPFYEVTLTLEIDTETGNYTLVKTKL